MERRRKSLAFESRGRGRDGKAGWSVQTGSRGRDSTPWIGAFKGWEAPR